jgi:hypothetical protein
MKMQPFLVFVPEPVLLNTLPNTMGFLALQRLKVNGAQLNAVPSI